MKNKGLLMLTAVTLLFLPKINFAQSAPDLGVAASFAVFTGAGQFANDGTTFIRGDIGTNVGAFAEFPPGIVVGEIHVADVVSAQAATDVAEAYMYLDEITCEEVLGTTLGNGQILTPGVYCLGAASTINGDLILDAQGDPNALFIFQIDGALSTTTLSNVVLVNGASLCNVYLQVNGAVALGVSSVFRGTIVANGAITLLENATLYGRALSTAGEIALHNNVVESPGASNCGTVCNLVIDGTVTNVTCKGKNDGAIDVTVDSANGDVTYLWNDAVTTEDRINLPPGTYSVTATDSAGCSDSASFTITEPKKLRVTGSVTQISSNRACDATAQITAKGGTAPYTYIWNDGYVGSTRSGLCMGLYTVTITDANGCQLVVKVKIYCLPKTVTASSTASESNLTSVTPTPATVSPNPSNGQIRVSINALKDQPAAIAITDFNGKLMFTDKINLIVGNNVKSYNFSSFAGGVYFLRIKTNDNEEVLKVIRN